MRPGRSFTLGGGPSAESPGADRPDSTGAGPSKPRDANPTSPRRSLSTSERARLYAYADAQTAEEAALQRRMRRLLSVITRNGRADCEDQAEMMFQLTRGRAPLPAGNIAATMALAIRLAERARRRVTGKPGSSGGRRWSRGLHPGLWRTDERTTPHAPAYRPVDSEATTRVQIGVVAIR